MKLVPTDTLPGLFAKAYDDDPDSASALLRLALFEALTDQIEPVRDRMTERVLSNVAAVNKAARSRILGVSVSKSITDEVLDYAEDLAVVDEWVSKGFASDVIQMLREKAEKQPRDSSGRFVRVQLGGDTDPNLPVGSRLGSHMIEALDQRDRWTKAGLIDANTTLMLGRALIDDKGRASGTIRRQKVKAGDLEGELNSHPDHLPMELSVARGDLKHMSPQQLAGVDLAALATQSNMETGQRLTRGLFDEQGQVKNQRGNAERWYGATNGTDRQAYRRIKMTGQALSSVSVPGSELSIAGGIAQLVGDLGPEAETILGPGIRRTAYRYRGTERRPDRDLYKTVERATRLADGLNSNSPETRSSAANAIASSLAARGEKDAAAVMASQYTGNMPADQRDLMIRGSAAIAVMLGASKGPAGRARSALPDLELTELSLASGEMPPSEGVIIDAHGRVVSQAVGYNGDHYLPFDLKNLNALYGGQYVRTRATGGPTTEDIYTALVTGARQIQVVSNSGVFTVEFDPDLRGARRFNDKVKRMTTRYGEMLETIHQPGHGLYENDLSAEQKLDIRQRAAAASRTTAEFNETRARLEEEARVKGSVRDVSDDELEEAAYSHAEATVDREIRGMASTDRPSRQARARLVEEAARTYIANQDPGVRELQLNGTGYDRALRALKQEFPYYIRQATFEPLPQWLAERGMPTMGYKRNAPKDRGFVEPGQTNPSAGRKGPARSARLVPTGRGQQAERPPTQAAAGAPETQSSQQTPSGTSEKTPSAATAAPARTVDLNQVAGPNGELTRQLGVQLSMAIDMARKMPPAINPGAGAQDEDYQALGPYAFFHHKATEFSRKSSEGMAGRDASRWLMTEATPDQRRDFLAGVQALPEERDQFPEMQGMPAESVTSLANRVSDLTQLTQPFAEVEQGTPAWQVEPKATRKPPHFDSTPALDAPDDEWAHARARLDLDEYQRAAFDDLESKSPTEQMAMVQDMYDDWRQHSDENSEANLQNYQVAWSFLHAQRVAAKLRGLGGGGAAPLGEGRQIGKRQSDPPAREFLLALRQRIDGLL